MAYSKFSLKDIKEKLDTDKNLQKLKFYLSKIKPHYWGFCLQILFSRNNSDIPWHIFSQDLRNDHAAVGLLEVF